MSGVRLRSSALAREADRGARGARLVLGRGHLAVEGRAADRRGAARRATRRHLRHILRGRCRDRTYDFHRVKVTLFR